MKVVRITLIVILLLVLTLSSTVFALESTDDPFPRFQLIFGAFDAPVEIIQAKLQSNQFDVDVDFTHDSGNRTFNFSSTAYLVNGIYDLVIIAEDKDGNIIPYEDEIEVDADVMDIWISNPEHLEFGVDKQTQDVAVRKSLPFDDIFLKTEYDAVCKIRSQLGAPPENLVDMFNLMQIKFNEGSTSPTQTHSLHVVQSGATNPFPGYSFLTIDSPFDNEDYVLQNSFLVICKQEVAGGDIIYHPKIFYVGQDESMSDFTGYFTPPLIQDTAAMRTNFHVESSEDLLGCHYAFIENPVPEQIDDLGPVNIEFPLETIHEFSTYYDKEFSFQGQVVPLGERFDYSINVTCFNLAMEQKSHTYSFAMELTTVFDIILERSHYQEKKPTLEFSTSLLAQCYYEFNYGESTHNGFVSNDPQTEHLVDIPETLEDGDYNINMLCTADTPEQKTFTFTIDTVAPVSPIITSRDYDCGTTLSLDLGEPINDTVQYNISLYNGSSTSGTALLDGYVTSFVSENFTYTLPSGIDVKKNSTYTWEVTAIDQGGLSSPTITKTVTTKEPSATECDVFPPLGQALISKTDLGFGINITCLDTQSGCTNSFSYAIQPVGTGCASAIMNTGSYGTPLTSVSDGTLCYEVRDVAGNSANYSKQLASAISADIELIAPKFGIGKTKDFTFTVETTKAVTCKHGPSTVGSDLSSQYASLKQFGFTGSTQHTDTIKASDYSVFDTTQTEQQNAWMVICTDGSEYYKSTLNEFGYDVTDPVITISVSPQTLTDPLKQETTLSISADDPVVCTYLNQKGVPQAFPLYDPNKRTSYGSSHVKLISYFGINNEDVTQLISCRNVAQSVGEAIKIIHVEPENTLVIEVLSDSYYRTTGALLEVKTSGDAACEYLIGKSGSFSLFQTTGETSHKKQLSLNEAENIIQIKCEKGNVVSKQYETITIDTKNPDLSILTSPTTCSTSQIKAIAFTDGTGSPIDKYTYVLLDTSGTVLTNGDSSKNNLIIDYSMSAGESYTLSVTASDKAGNTATEDTTIIAGSASCESSPPTAEVSFQAAWNKTRASVDCTDNHECASYFTYGLTDDSTCQNIQQSYVYTNQPLDLLVPQTLCYTAYDAAGNSVSGTENIPLYLQCFNGIEDPSELGVDCGGPCVATCGTCTNGKQDGFEEGVDCGWVCESVKTCQQEVIPERECDTDLDCASGYTCNYKGNCITDSTTSDYDFYADDGSKTNILGVILIILGLLLMGGGIYYIYYLQSEKLKHVQTQQRPQVSPQSQSQAQQEAAKRQQEAAKRRAQMLQERREKQGEVRSQRIEERKEKRKSILGAFSSGDTKEEKETKPSPSKEIFEKREAGKKPSSGEYVDLSETKKPTKKSKTGALDALSSVASQNVSTPSKGAAKKKVSLSSSNKKHNVFDDIDDLASKSNLSSHPGEDYFKTLENTVKAAKGKSSDEIIESLATNIGNIQGKIDPKDFVEKFTKSALTHHLDDDTLKKLVSLLLKEGKLDKQTAKTILDKLT